MRALRGTRSGWAEQASKVDAERAGQQELNFAPRVRGRDVAAR